MDEIKLYVNVIAKFDREGIITPMLLEWNDGLLYDVEKVVAISECSSRRIGGQGVHYKVQIGSRQAVLSFEDPCWFISKGRL